MEGSRVSANAGSDQSSRSQVSTQLTACLLVGPSVASSSEAPSAKNKEKTPVPLFLVIIREHTHCLGAIPMQLVLKHKITHTKC